jgi:hypothetical protein
MTCTLTAALALVAVLAGSAPVGQRPLRIGASLSLTGAYGKIGTYHASTA